ncbi:hypothetical protein Dimus_008535 [Dionaea muscipula]
MSLLPSTVHLLLPHSIRKRRQPQRNLRASHSNPIRSAEVAAAALGAGTARNPLSEGSFSGGDHELTELLDGTRGEEGMADRRGAGEAARGGEVLEGGDDVEEVALCAARPGGGRGGGFCERLEVEGGGAELGIRGRRIRRLGSRLIVRSARRRSS